MRSDRRPEWLALAEAALYVAGRPLSIDVIRSVIGCGSKRRTREILRELIRRYRKPDTPFEILELEGERYVFQLRPSFFEKVRRVAEPLVGKGALRTLALIAYRQPITQKEVTLIRGRHAYAHIRVLENLGLVVRERFGRTWLLRTSNAFADLFGFSYDLRGLKAQIRSLLERLGKGISKPVESARPRASG